MFSNCLIRILFISALLLLPLPSTHAQPAMIPYTHKLPIPVPKPIPITMGGTLAIGSTLGKTAGQFVEGLLPLSITHRQLSFVQAGFYFQSQHQTFSLGWSQRFFITPTAHWGYNLFYDRTVHQQHHQWSLGGELRWNTLKLFANSYWPLSGWKVSERHRGYGERPTQKVDLGIQGYLAKAPWLGASLHYQRNLGTQGSPSNALLCQDPSSRWVIGFGYTPVSLLTIDYRYQTGPRQARHRFGLTANFRLHTPLTQQLDPNSIARLRTSRGYQFDRIPRQQGINMTYKCLINTTNNKQFIAPKGPNLPAPSSGGNTSSKTAAKAVLKKKHKQHCPPSNQSVPEENSDEATDNDNREELPSDEESTSALSNYKRIKANTRFKPLKQEIKNVNLSLHQIEKDQENVGTNLQSIEEEIKNTGHLLQQSHTVLKELKSSMNSAPISGSNALEAQLAQEYLEKLDQPLSAKRESFDDSGYYEDLLSNPSSP